MKIWKWTKYKKPPAGGFLYAETALAFAFVRTETFFKKPENEKQSLIMTERENQSVFITETSSLFLLCDMLASKHDIPTLLARYTVASLLFSDMELIRFL